MNDSRVGFGGACGSRTKWGWTMECSTDAGAICFKCSNGRCILEESQIDFEGYAIRQASDAILKRWYY